MKESRGRKLKYGEKTITIVTRCPASKAQELKNIINKTLGTWASEQKPMDQPPEENILNEDIQHEIELIKAEKKPSMISGLNWKAYQDKRIKALTAK